MQIIRDVVCCIASCLAIVTVHNAVAAPPVPIYRFQDPSGNVVELEPGDTLILSGGGNITLVLDPVTRTYKIEIKNAPTFSGKLTAGGIDANGGRVENVHFGVLPTDAANLAQVEQQVGRLGTQIGQLLGGGSFYDPVSRDIVTTLQVNGQAYLTINDALNALSAPSSPWTLSAQGSAPLPVAAGGNVDLRNQDGNLIIHRDASGSAINFNLAQHLRVEGLTIGAGTQTTIVNGLGVNIQKGPSMTTNGIDAADQVIRNVRMGTAAHDAVNVAQMQGADAAVLAQSHAYTDTQIASVRHDVQAMGRSAYGGAASAMAIGSLPQALLPGNGMTTIGVSHYHGEQAIALGVSTLSSDGRRAFKLSGTGNTSGDWGVALGAGFGW